MLKKIKNLPNTKEGLLNCRCVPYFQLAKMRQEETHGLCLGLSIHLWMDGILPNSLSCLLAAALFFSWSDWGHQYEADIFKKQSMPDFPLLM